MIWIIDTDVLIEGERGREGFKIWAESGGKFATADIVRAEFLMGVHQTADAAKRERGTRFYEDKISKLPSLTNEPADFVTAARLAGEARREQKGSPSLADGLIAAVALRIGATVATKNTRDFAAMGCPCENPFAGSEPVRA